MKENVAVVARKEWEELRRRARLGFWAAVVKGTEEGKERAV